MELKDPPAQGIVQAIKAAATKVIRKVQRLIKPKQKSHKEVIINSESLETRVVLEEGKLEEFNIERTTEERLVGSIFKGKVRNLEDGLKAAFVDIGFEKNFSITGTSSRATSTAALKSSIAANASATSLASRKRTSRASIRRAATSLSRSPKARSAPKARA